MGMDMVMHRAFASKKGRFWSWVDLGGEFAMKAASDRAKASLFASAVATLPRQFFSPAPEGEPISEQQPLISDGRSQLLPPLRGGWQVLRVAGRSAPTR